MPHSLLFGNQAALGLKGRSNNLPLVDEELCIVIDLMRKRCQLINGDVSNNLSLFSTGCWSGET